MVVAITPTVQDVWPPRVALAVTGLTIGNVVTIYRVTGGKRIPVRVAEAVTVASTAIARTDAELPFGVPVGWTVNVNGSDVASTSTATYDLPGGQVALTDAITGLAAEVALGAWPSRRRERRASVFALTPPDGGPGANTVVTGAVGQFTAQIELVTLTGAAADTLEALLVAATGGTVQLRTADASSYGRFECYVTVLAWEEVLWSQDGTDPKRRWVLDVVEVSGWPSGYEAQAWTYADLAAAYPGPATYTTLAGDFATYVDLAVADVGAI